MDYAEQKYIKEILLTLSKPEVDELDLKKLYMLAEHLEGITNTRLKHFEKYKDIVCRFLAEGQHELIIETEDMAKLSLG